MQTVNIHEAKTTLSQLIERVEHGEEVIIARARRPVARLTALQATAKPTVRLGLMKGQIQLAEDFDDPLPAGVLRDFTEGQKI
ncbi:MAG: type II toxin-antitoxin system prevent-host-death family antitoxin [Thiomonas sp.]|nr:type II toxin-antitoxin system prevent-host-death family antitoxin [Thiomonas sp.]